VEDVSLAQPLLEGDSKLEDLQQELSDLLSKLGQVRPARNAVE
jgi:hypothetical protein